MRPTLKGKIYGEAADVGLLGCGSVGRGLVELVGRNEGLLRERTGVELNISKILVRDLKKRRYALPLLRRRHGTLAVEPPASADLGGLAPATVIPVAELPRPTLASLVCLHLACSPLVELVPGVCSAETTRGGLGVREVARGFVDCFDLVVAPGSSAARLPAWNVSGADARPRVPDGFWSSELGLRLAAWLHGRPARKAAGLCGFLVSRRYAATSAVGCAVTCWPGSPWPRTSSLR